MSLPCDISTLDRCLFLLQCPIPTSSLVPMDTCLVRLSKIYRRRWPSKIDSPMMLIDRILLVEVHFEELVVGIALVVLVPS